MVALNINFTLHYNLKKSFPEQKLCLCVPLASAWRAQPISSSTKGYYNFMREEDRKILATTML